MFGAARSKVRTTLQGVLKGLKQFLVGESGAGPYGEAAMIIVVVILVVVILKALKGPLETAMNNLGKVLQQQ